MPVRGPLGYRLVSERSPDRHRATFLSHNPLNSSKASLRRRRNNTVDTLIFQWNLKGCRLYQHDSAHGHHLPSGASYWAHCCVAVLLQRG